jgi:hypothetical protein
VVLVRAGRLIAYSLHPFAAHLLRPFETADRPATAATAATGGGERRAAATQPTYAAHERKARRGRGRDAAQLASTIAGGVAGVAQASRQPRATDAPRATCSRQALLSFSTTAAAACLGPLGPYMPRRGLSSPCPVLCLRPQDLNQRLVSAVSASPQVTAAQSCAAGCSRRVVGRTGLQARVCPVADAASVPCLSAYALGTRYQVVTAIACHEVRLEGGPRGCLSRGCAWGPVRSHRRGRLAQPAWPAPNRPSRALCWPPATSGDCAWSRWPTGRCRCACACRPRG